MLAWTDQSSDSCPYELHGKATPSTCRQQYKTREKPYDDCSTGNNRLSIRILFIIPVICKPLQKIRRVIRGQGLENMIEYYIQYCI